MSISFDSSINGISLYAVHGEHIFPRGSGPDLTGVNENLSTCLVGSGSVPGCEQGTSAGLHQPMPPCKSVLSADDGCFVSR